MSLTFALLLYLSVLVHELSHTVVALRSGLPVRRISLHLLGGVSEIERPAETPGREAGIAVAGPLVSLLLAAVAFGVGELLEPGTVGRLLARALMLSNLLVGRLQPAARPAAGRRPGAVGRGLAGHRTPAHRHRGRRLGRPGRRRRPARRCRSWWPCCAATTSRWST